jgi:hypothetical protein
MLEKLGRLLSKIWQRKNDLLEPPPDEAGWEEHQQYLAEMYRRRAREEADRE